jgi:hypothetical protein
MTTGSKVIILIGLDRVNASNVRALNNMGDFIDDSA